MSHFSGGWVVVKAKLPIKANALYLAFLKDAFKVCLQQNGDIFELFLGIHLCESNF